MNSKSGTENGMVEAVRKCFAILDCFTPTQPELSLSQLSRLCGISKSTLLNQVRTMEAAGYLQKNPKTQAYRLGYKLMSLGYRVQAASPLLLYAVPVMEDLQEVTGQTVYLTSHLDGRVFYLECVYPMHRSQAYSVSGKTLPMHCTSCGKAMMSRMPEHLVDAILEQHGMPACTQNTITDPAQLKAALDQYRRQGYAVDEEEESVGIRCVAVPICSSTGEVAGALSLSGSTMTLRQELLEQYAVRLSQAAGILSRYASLFPALQDK